MPARLARCCTYLNPNPNLDPDPSRKPCPNLNPDPNSNPHPNPSPNPNQVLHSWEMLERPRAWLAETVHDALQHEVHVRLAADLPAVPLARHLTVAELQTYARLR